MKQLLCVFSLCWIVLTSCAQQTKMSEANTSNNKGKTDTVTNSDKPGWKVVLNGKQVLQTNTENESSNRKAVSTADLGCKASLEIIYTESPDAKLKRSFIVMNNQRNELLRKDDITKFTLSSRELASLAQKSKELVIYTLGIPSDPAVAATVRVRPVHVFTLAVQ